MAYAHTWVLESLYRQACTFVIIAIVSFSLILKGKEREEQAIIKKETSGHGAKLLDNTIPLW